jgi:glycosyltransferase involved in cell wall biosynthesis
MSIKVCFLTSVYPSALESRMFYKEAKTLSSAGYEVVFICQHVGASTIDGIRIVPLPRPKSRLDRFTRTILRLFVFAIKENATVYHLHSPELLPIGLILKLGGKKVIYDAHEAFEQHIFSKDWIHPRLRRPVSALFRGFEETASKCVDHVIAADRFTANQFHQENVTVIANYAVLSLLRDAKTVAVPKPPVGRTRLIYAGGLGRDRGLSQMVATLGHLSDLDIELYLLGRLSRHQAETAFGGIARVRHLGFVPLEAVFAHLLSASVGLVLLQPVPAYLYAGENTNKLFEYMACGLPIIASDFPNLRPIVLGTGCGLCVDPTSPEEIAKAIRLLHENPRMRAEMGENGRRAVATHYNWELEGAKLLAVYRRLSGLPESGEDTTR